MGTDQTFRLILGSSSPARRYLLERAGYQFDVKPAHIEEPTHAGYPSPRHLVQHIAWLKAAAVAPTTVEEGIVLTADTVGWLDGQVLGKPADEADARRILRFLGGRVHELWTGVCLWRRPDDLQTAWQERTLVRFKALSDADLDSYIASRQWENNAGAYAIKEDGDPYIEIIEGSITNVIGLPMESLRCLLPVRLHEPHSPFRIKCASERQGGAMNSPTANRDWLDLSRFRENRDAVPLEVLAPYIGQHVAWSPDGIRILASAADLGELIEKLTAAGIEGGQFIHDFIDDPNEAHL